MLCDSLPPKSRPSTILAESQNHRRFVQPFQLQLLDSLHGESRMRLPASHYSVYNHRPVIIAQPLTTLRHSGQLLSSTLALMAGCCSALISDGAVAAYMSGSRPGDASVLGCPVRSAPPKLFYHPPRCLCNSALGSSVVLMRMSPALIPTRVDSDSPDGTNHDYYRRIVL